VLHKKNDLGGTVLEGLTHPMLETAEQWSVYGFTFPNCLAELGPNAQVEVAQHASLDKAMRDALRKLRRFLMTVHRLSEDEAIALMSVAADFDVTQAVTGACTVRSAIACLPIDRRVGAGSYGSRTRQRSACARVWRRLGA
jgi:acetamidase/formamidase